MNPDKPTFSAVIPGDGGNGPVSADELATLKNEVQEINQQTASPFWQRRETTEDTRYCRWDGQSTDGRKHREALANQEAFPFEGASDGRIRLADMIVNERVLVLRAALTRATLQVSGVDFDDLPRAAALKILMDWLLENQLGADYLRELIKVAQWQEGDSPGAAVLGVYWHQETALEMQRVTIESLAADFSRLYGQELDPATLGDLQDLFLNPLRQENALGVLAGLLPTVRPGRMRAILTRLRDDGMADFPAPYLRVNAPRLVAHRLFDDLFIPVNTGSLQRARVILRRDWLGETEIRERELTLGWHKDFVRGVLGHEGQTAFPTLERDPVNGDYSESAHQTDPTERQGLFEVLTAYRRAVNEDGIPGIYVYTFHPDVDRAAGERVILDYAHGKYPFVAFTREILSNRLLDTRGVPEVAMTQQESLKLLHDSFNDHTQLSTVPPIKVPLERPARMQLVIGPLKQVKEARPGEVSWMQPPAYPQTNDVQQKEIRRQADEYFGRKNELVDPALWELHMQGLVDWFFVGVREALTMVVQLAQQYLPDETVQRVLGAAGVEVTRGREEIQGQYDLKINFDVRNLSMEHIKELAEVLSTLVLPMDSEATIKRDQLVQDLFSAINPTLARRTLQPVEAVNEKEVKDEELNFALIAAGIEPEFKEKGQNHALRLRVLLGIGQKNPPAFERLDDTSRQILQRRMEQMQFQVQQGKNAIIGRIGAAPVLEDTDEQGADAGAGGMME